MNTDIQAGEARAVNRVRGDRHRDRVEEQSKAQLRLSKCQERERQERKARTLTTTRLNHKTIVIHNPQSDFAEALIGQVAGQDAGQAYKAQRQAEGKADLVAYHAEREAERKAKRERRRQQAKIYYHTVVKPRNERKKQLGL